MAEQALYVSAEFKCFDDLDAAISQYESTKYINLYKRNSRTIAAYGKQRKDVTKTIPEQLKFAELDYACIHGGRKFKTKSEGARPNQSTFQQQCPMVVVVRLSQDWQRLVVKKLTEDHNHPISQVAYKHLPRQRRLDPKTREEVNCMLQVKTDKKLIQHHVYQSTGRILTMKDLHNLGQSRGADTENELQALLYEMQKEPGGVTEVVLGANHELHGLYYQDLKMQQIQRAFPELMVIDATYKLNDLRMPLYVLMSLDSNGESYVIALWIVTSEERTTVAALTDIFVRLNSADQIKCIMADKDMVERDVMREKIPHAVLKIGVFQTLKMFRRKITCEKMGIKSEQKQKRVIRNYSGMVTFFRDLKTGLAVLETERIHRTLQIVQKSSTVQCSPNSPESQYLCLLTPYASRFVSSQLSSASFPKTTVPDGTTTTSCTCRFWQSMSLPCKHIFKKRAESGLPLYAEELVAQRWHKSYYLYSHPVINETAEPAVILTQQHTVIQQPMSQSDKYKRAFCVAQRLSVLVSECTGEMFRQRLGVLEELEKLWRQEIKTVVEVGQNHNLVNPATPNTVQDVLSIPVASHIVISQRRDVPPFTAKTEEIPSSPVHVPEHIPSSPVHTPAQMPLCIPTSPVPVHTSPTIAPVTLSASHQSQTYPFVDILLALADSPENCNSIAHAPEPKPPRRKIRRLCRTKPAPVTRGIDPKSAPTTSSM